MSKIDVSKLEFKKEFAESGQMSIWIDAMRKLMPITREQLLVAVNAGHHYDKLKTFFTLESISLAKEEPKTKKSKTDEGSN